jgi:coiled-coil domain-containing protein 63/114
MDSRTDRSGPPTMQIQLEQRKVALSEVEYKQLQDKLNAQQEVIKVAGGIKSATEKAVALHKEIRRHESHRQQASVKFNEAFTHCKKLRTQIDSLRRERLVFDGIHGKLEKEIQVQQHASFFLVMPGPIGCQAKA